MQTAHVASTDDGLIELLMGSESCDVVSFEAVLVQLSDGYVILAKGAGDGDQPDV